MWRSRWAAIGAAVAVTLGGGSGLLTFAATGTPSVLVNVTPTRVLDTRIGVGLTGPNATGVGRTLDVTGTIPVVQADGTPGTALVVPDGATAIVANLTAVEPTAAGFVSIRPGDASGTPTTSNINLANAGGAVPNSITVPIHSDGTVNLYYFGVAPGSTTHLLLDIVGYYQATTTPSAPKPARVVWVAASGGDFTTVNAALASITDASLTTPYVVKVAPGVYDEPGGVTMKSYVDVEGSGAGTTTIRCVCSAAAETGAGVATVRFPGAITAQLRGVTVTNTGGGAYATGVLFDSTGSAASLVDAAVTSTGGTTNTYGIQSLGSTARIERTDVIVTGGAGSFTEGVLVNGAAAPVLDELDVTASGPGVARGVTVVGSASQVIVSDSVIRANSTAPGAGTPVGVWVGANARVEQTRITVTGGSVARGVAVFGATGEIDEVVISATGGTTSVGVDHTFASAKSFTSDSSITGATNSVRRNDVGQEVRIATTKLVGATTGTPTCFNTYGSTFAAFACA